MNLNSQTQGNVDVVELPPRLVMADAPGARNALRELIGQGRRRLVLDLGNVAYIDSSGLSVLISTLKAAQAAQGEVVLLNPSAEVRALIELTRLHQVFEIFEDSAAAVTRLAS